MNQQFGLIWDGFFTQEDIDKMMLTSAKFASDPNYKAVAEDFPMHTFKANYNAGDYKYKDINSDGRVDNNDRKAIGYTYNPEMTYGLGFSARYKGLDFSVWFQGASNYTIIMRDEGIVPFILGGYGSAPVQAMDRWHIENGEVVEGFWPRMTTSRDANNYQASDRWQMDLSYIRLKNAEIGFTLPQKWVQNAKLSNIRIYLNGINLYTWSKFDWWDVDIAEMPFGRYPIMQTWNAGINVEF